MTLSKYNGIFPAFLACYDKNGQIDTNLVEVFTEYLIQKGIKGLYVNGSSGECIYQSVEERKLVLEHVMKANKGRITIIAHVACPNTADSCVLASHAESLGVDAISAIPPIYYRLPESAIRNYWNTISASAPNTDFILYNIPQLTGISLSPACLKELVKQNKRVVGVKNTSMSVLDIGAFKAAGGENFMVFNGPDEQLMYGLLAGAIGGIGGTYSVCPELFIKIKEAVDKADFERAKTLQAQALKMIEMLLTCQGSSYAIIKEVIKLRSGIDLGGARSPFVNVTPEDMPKIKACVQFIDQIEKSL